MTCAEFVAWAESTGWKVVTQDEDTVIGEKAGERIEWSRGDGVWRVRLHRKRARR